MFPGLLACQGAVGKMNEWLEILSWSHLCMCVKERSDFLLEPPERAKQLTSKCTLTEVHYSTEYKGLNYSSCGCQTASADPPASPAEGPNAVST